MLDKLSSCSCDLKDFRFWNMSEEVSRDRKLISMAWVKDETSGTWDGLQVDKDVIVWVEFEPVMISQDRDLK